MKALNCIFLFIGFIGSCYAETGVLCNEHDDYFREDLIKITDYSCDSKGDCGLVAVFPKKIKGTDFNQLNLKHGSWNEPNLFVALQTFENKDSLDAVIYGKKENLEKLELYLSYKPIKGCFYWSIIELKHNKVKNLRSLRSLGRAEDARPF